MNLSIYVKGDYEEFQTLKAAKKQTQTKLTLSEVKWANIEWNEVFLSIAQKIATALRASQ
jgi:hypothetical protein